MLRMTRDRANGVSTNRVRCSLLENDKMPGMDLQLRPIRHQDVSRLAGLLDQLGYPTTEAAVHERLDHWLGDPSSWLIGVADDGQLVGVAALHVMPMLEVDGKL